MKNLLTCFILLGTFQVFSQNYWQQEVNYTIDVKLNDEDHILYGFETFEYINNSPETLNEIYVHLWPNAYRNNKTALAKQLYSNGNDILEFASDEERGYIDSLNFMSGSIQLDWEYENYNIDIAIIHLNEALKPGDRVEISTPFTVKIPSGSISRLGHIGQSYQITQWYPKPAVFDDQGWHHMPYLNQGEFFSEYGSFDVRITLPENYVVGATGDLQTSTEIDFMNNKASQTAEAIKNGKHFVKDPNLDKANDFPESDKAFKTIHFTQSNVHDFAWFADKRFQVLKGEVELPHSKRKVTTWALYTPRNGKLWSNALEYIQDGTYYYSLWNGDYPYNNVTAVDGTISAGGGMEYPNVTVIGNTSNAKELEIVIVHEVGHNWFYGQLGSNERVHGWMDEGMNTLNEIRYVQTKYPDNEVLTEMVRIIGNMDFHFNDLDHHDQGDVAYRMLAYLGEDQPVEMHSAKFTQANYGVVMYMKTGLLFYYLKDFLGEELFDKAMQTYYSEWEFKHPRPEHMKASLEKTSGKDLTWLFEDLIKTTKHVEFKISKVKKEDNGSNVFVKNVGQVNSPVEIATYLNGELVETKWSMAERKAKVHFEKPFDQVRIDPGKDIPEINRNNNIWHQKGLKKVEPIKFEFLIGDNEPEHTNIFWTPFLAGNLYDKFMIGGSVHNMGIVPNKFSYILTPMYSVGRNNLSGFAEISYNCLPAKGLKQSKFGLSIKSFKNDSIYRKNNSYYVGFSPYWKGKIGNRGVKKHYQQNVRIQGLYRYDQLGDFNMDLVGGIVSYQYQYNLQDHKIGFEIRNDFLKTLNDTSSFDRIMLEVTYDWKYLRKMDRHIKIRAFGGTYLNYSYGNETAAYNPYGMSLSGAAGYQDIYLENYYLGRNETAGFYSNQRTENMGGFKSTSFYGTTSHWLTSVNMEMQLPFIPKMIQIYGDYGVFYNGLASNEAYQIGLGIKFGPVLSIYMPFYMSTELRDSYGSSNMFDKYGEKIRFTLNLNLFDKPFQLSQFLN